MIEKQRIRQYNKTFIDYFRNFIKRIYNEFKIYKIILK